MQNITNLCNLRQTFINLFNDYVTIRSEAIFKTKYGTGLKY